MALPDYPLINGLRHDWSSLQIEIGTLKINGLKALSYKHSLEPGEVRGISPQVLGHTQGTYSAEGSVEMYLSEANELKAILGNGYMTKVFNVVAKYSPKKGDPVITDKLIGCRIKTEDKSFTQGNEPLAVKFDLFVMVVIPDGVNPLPTMLGV